MQATQLSQPDAIPERPPGTRGDLGGQAGLANPPWAGQRDEPGRTQRLAYLCKFGPPPDELSQLPAQPAGRSIRTHTASAPATLGGTGRAGQTILCRQPAPAACSLHLAHYADTH